MWVQHDRVTSLEIRFAATRVTVAFRSHPFGDSYHRTPVTAAKVDFLLQDTLVHYNLNTHYVIHILIHSEKCTKMEQYQ